MENSSLSKEEIDELIKIIQDLYLEDEIPWVVGYSGGKDSTAVLQLVWIALTKIGQAKRSNKPVHVISTDTLVESPVVAAWVKQSLEQMKAAAADQDLPIEVHRLTPAYNNTFWVNLIGKGYPAPRPYLRWCTSRLKIDPSNTFILDIIDSYGEAILVLGTRKAESARRAATMNLYEKQRLRDYLSPNASLQNSFVFSPIENWSNDHVWQFLMQYKNPWNYSNKDLLSMYRGATDDGECPLVLDTNTPSCGSSRFGCWVCTLVEEDKSMAAMIQNDEEKVWMTPLLDFRNELADWENDRQRREFRRKNGRLMLHRDRLVHGPYTKANRENLLRRLLKIQKQINTDGPEEFRDLKLITDEELREIRRIWLIEKHEFDDALPRIYQEITGERYLYEDDNKNIFFGANEWQLLREICDEMYPKEELLLQLSASLLDIERQTSILNLRKGVLNSMEETIRRCYYKDEQDAEAVAQGRAERAEASVDTVLEEEL
jgi:DNA sulfur modification protein DndC